MATRPRSSCRRATVGRSRADEIAQWVLSCQRESGGFGMNNGHDAHITATHYALLLLAQRGGRWSGQAVLRSAVV